MCCRSNLVIIICPIRRLSVSFIPVGEHVGWNYLDGIDACVVGNKNCLKKCFPQTCRSLLGCQGDANADLEFPLYWKQVNLSRLIGRSEYQRARSDGLFSELPLTPAFIWLSACCCWNNKTSDMYKVRRVFVRSQVRLRWIHQLNQVNWDLDWQVMCQARMSHTEKSGSRFFLEPLFQTLPPINPIREKFANPSCFRERENTSTYIYCEYIEVL